MYPIASRPRPITGWRIGRALSLKRGREVSPGLSVRSLGIVDTSMSQQESDYDGVTTRNPKRSQGRLPNFSPPNQELGDDS